MEDQTNSDSIPILRQLIETTIKERRAWLSYRRNPQGLRDEIKRWQALVTEANILAAKRQARVDALQATLEADCEVEIQSCDERIAKAQKRIQELKGDNLFAKAQRMAEEIRQLQAIVSGGNNED